MSNAFNMAKQPPKTISIRFDADVLRKLDTCQIFTGKNRTELIHEAVRKYVKELWVAQMIRESEYVRERNLKILHEFEALPDPILDAHPYDWGPNGPPLFADDQTKLANAA